MTNEKIITEIIDSAYTVRRVLGSGYLESVYQHALSVELNLRGIKSDIEQPIEVIYKGIVVGNYRADLVVNDEIIVELKVAEEICLKHELQLVNYLQSTRLKTGLLINFGPDRVTVKRKYRDKKSI